MEYRYNGRNLEIKGARITFKNFSGIKTQFNREGQRKFAVIIDDPAAAEQLIADGWNLKLRKSHDEDAVPVYSLEVKVNFVDPSEGRPGPKIVRIIDEKEFPVDSSTISQIDSDDIISCSMSIRPYEYDVNGKRGISAYLRTLYVFIESDNFLRY